MAEVECSVCLQQLTDSERSVTLPCSDKHVFHEACIRAWETQCGGQPSCPLCRVCYDVDAQQQRTVHLERTLQKTFGSSEASDRVFALPDLETLTQEYEGEFVDTERIVYDPETGETYYADAYTSEDEDGAEIDYPSDPDSDTESCSSYSYRYTSHRKRGFHHYDMDSDSDSDDYYHEVFNPRKRARYSCDSTPSMRPGTFATWPSQGLGYVSADGLEPLHVSCF